jgi:hypothetical protein
MVAAHPVPDANRPPDGRRRGAWQASPMAVKLARARRHKTPERTRAGA